MAGRHGLGPRGPRSGMCVVSFAGRTQKRSTDIVPVQNLDNPVTREVPGSGGEVLFLKAPQGVYEVTITGVLEELRVTLGAQWKRELRTTITTTDHLTVSVRPGASDTQAVAKPPGLVEELCLEAELLKGWDDPEFQRRYATAHRKELLANAS